jgi:hypothetical protein
VKSLEKCLPAARKSDAGADVGQPYKEWSAFEDRFERATFIGM